MGLWTWYARLDEDGMAAIRAAVAGTASQVEAGRELEHADKKQAGKKQAGKKQAPKRQAKNLAQQEKAEKRGEKASKQAEKIAEKTAEKAHAQRQPAQALSKLAEWATGQSGSPATPP